MKKLVNKNGEVYKEEGPYYNGLKAISPSKITNPLWLLAYGIQKEKPDYLEKAMDDGKLFEKGIAIYLKTRQFSLGVKYANQMNFPKSKNKMLQALKYLAVKIKFTPQIFGLNTINYCMYKDTFIACESDIEFEKYIGEVKKTSTKGKEHKWIRLAYEIQCYIQELCFNKKVKWFGATDEGKINNSFVKYPNDIEDGLDFLLRIADLTEEEQLENIKSRVNGEKEIIGV